MTKVNFTSTKTKFLKVFSISILFFIGCNQKEKNNIERENWEIVRNSVRNATELSNKRSYLLNEIYSNLSPENKLTNLEKLEEIKSISIEIEKRIRNNNDILFTHYVKQNKPEIFKIGLNYINSSAHLEKLLPTFYEKVKKDINGQQTERDEAILNAAEKIINETEKYQNLMNNYREQHNLDVQKINISTSGSREKLINAREN